MILKNVYQWMIRRALVVHLLHIGKTGGSALKTALRPLGRADIVLHGHDFTLADLRSGEHAVFAIRHPFDRFVSGFYSRLRCGRPLYDNAWTPVESWAFPMFGTANALAEGLVAPSEATRVLARRAMAGIAHVRTFMSDWLGSPEAFPALSSGTLAVLEQSELNADFERLKRLLDVGAARLPEDALRRHANGPEFDVRLSDRAKAALAAWFRNDLRLYDAACDLRQALMRRELHDPYPSASGLRTRRAGLESRTISSDH